MTTTRVVGRRPPADRRPASSEKQGTDTYDDRKKGHYPVLIRPPSLRAVGVKTELLEFWKQTPPPFKVFKTANVS